MARMHSHDPLNPQIVDEAAEWFVEFSTGEPDISTRRALDRWIRKSPEHVRAYLEMFPIWEDASLLDAKRALGADRLVALARDAAPNVVPFTSCQPSRQNVEEDARPQLGKTHRAWYAFAASIALTVLGIGGWLYIQRGVYATRVAEQRLISLPDGSDIELNARSKIRLRYRDRERRIELLEGQALFKVAKDPRRPFIVESGDTQVRAVGTLFDVYRKPSGTTVTVVEGRVAVQASPAESRAGTASPEMAVPQAHVTDRSEAVSKAQQARSSSAPENPAGEILLAAGEQLRVTPTTMEKAEHADVVAATAWRQRRLVFSATPLVEVAEEFNRYNSRQLIVQGAGLEQFNVSAVFSAMDLPSLLRFLRAQPNITVEETETEIRISEN